MPVLEISDYFQNLSDDSSSIYHTMSISELLFAILAIVKLRI